MLVAVALAVQIVCQQRLGRAGAANAPFFSGIKPTGRVIRLGHDLEKRRKARVRGGTCSG